MATPSKSGYKVIYIRSGIDQPQAVYSLPLTAPKYFRCRGHGTGVIAIGLRQ